MDRNLAIKKKAQLLIQKGQIDAALAEFDKLFDSGDRDPYDFILVADLLAKRGSMQEAVRRYRQAVDEYSRAELFKNAIAVCKKILRISKEDLQIHRSLGDLYAKEGLYGDAQIHYLEFAEGSIRRQEHESALDALDLVLSLSPDNEDLSEKYVEIAMRGDQPERGGKELLRRADRAEQAGRRSAAVELRERASTLVPSIAAPLAPSSETEAEAGDGTFAIEHGSGLQSVAEPTTMPPSPSGFESAAGPIETGDAGTLEPGVVALDAAPTQDASHGAGAGADASLEPGVVSLSPEPLSMPAAPPDAPEETLSFSTPFTQTEGEPEPAPVKSRPEPPTVAPAAAEPVAPAAPAAAEPEPVFVAPAEAAAPSHEELATTYLSAGKPELAADEFWKAAERSFFRGDLSRARAFLASLLQIAPQHEAALRRQVDITAQTVDRPAEARARFDLAERYLAMEEWALARAEYLRVLEIDGSNERARMRVQRLDALIHTPPAPGSNVDFDAIDVPRPASSVRVRDETPSNLDSLVDLEEIIDEFKQGIQNSISGEDHESHYDLGMAYMEMGLYDEAIAEFQIAQKGAPMELKSLEMVALCFLEKNEPGQAIQELTRALELPGHGPDETISIRYNLGMAHERLGNLDRALQHFEEVHVLNVDFLRVTTKVRELKQKLSGSRDLG
ncbi:MAG: tetratricopeptide repeat protein [Candidatus Eisenbacteria bacterium]